MSKEVITKEAEIEKECNVWLEKASAIKIVDQATLVVADTLAKDIKRHRTKTVEPELGPAKEAARKSWQIANDLFNKYVNPLKDAEKTIKDEIIVYNRKMEQVRWEAEEKAQREAEEKAREEKERLEKEAEQAATDGRTEEFEEKAAAAEQVTAEDYTPVARPAPANPKGTVVKDKWKAEVTDIWALIQAVAKDKNLINALQANEVYLGQRARSDKGSLKIPGVKVYNEGSVSIKA